MTLREKFRKFRKTEEYKNLKYFFAPNMNDKKYLFYNFLLFMFFAVLLAVFGR